MDNMKIYGADLLREIEEIKICGGDDNSHNSDLTIYLHDCPTWGDCKTICGL